jgi:hypothetical protein
VPSGSSGSPPETGSRSTSTPLTSAPIRRVAKERTRPGPSATPCTRCFASWPSSGTCLHAKRRRGKSGPSTGISSFVDESLRRIPHAAHIRARFDAGFYDSKLFAKLEGKSVTYLCGVPLTFRLTSIIRQISDARWSPCVDKDEGEVTEFGYLIGKDENQRFRRYVVKRIPVNVGEQMELETAGYHYWVLVTNDHTTDAVTLESERRHKGAGRVRDARAQGELRARRAAKARFHGQLGLAADRGHRAESDALVAAARIAR